MKRKIGSFFIMVIATSITMNPVAMALTDSKSSFFSANDILYYDPDTTACTPSGSATSTQNLTDAQKVAQSMIVGFNAADFSGMSGVVQKFNIGGVFIGGSGGDAFTKESVAGINKSLTSDLLVGADDEGGDITRFNKNSPSAAAIGKMSDSDAKKAGEKTGQVLVDHGVNLNLAPVLDVGTPKYVGTKYYSERAFSSNTSTITKKAGSYADGVISKGVGVTLKHFPGLGAVASDNVNTDLVKAVITKPVAELEKSDIVPYQQLKGKKNAILMFGNMAVSEWGATIPVGINSKAVDYATKTLGFTGLTTTDDLVGLGHWGISNTDAVVKAFTAGVAMPMIHYPGSPEKFDAIIKAVIGNKDAMSKVSAAYDKVISYKTALGLKTGSAAMNPSPTASATQTPNTAADSADNTSTTSSTSSASTTVNASGNKDYAGRTILTDDMMKKIQQYQPTYEKAATKAGIPWQMLAALHYRETSLAMNNPNDDGLFQILATSYPTGPVSQEVFQKMANEAANFLKNAAGSNASKLTSGDAATVKDVFFTYNGRAAVYVRQAKALGFSDGAEGSPYVMNKADAKRDPEATASSILRGLSKVGGPITSLVATGAQLLWGQIKTDGGGLSYPANNDYGAFVVYSALTGGVFATGSSCSDTTTATGLSTLTPGKNGWALSGENAMVFYSQFDPKWKNQSYGGKGSIGDCGCGPTSTAMVIATLSGDKSITPKTMADFFATNGGQDTGSCGSSWSLWANGSALAKKHNLKFTDLGADLSKVPEFVTKGGFVIMSQSHGLFTSGSGHILIIRGVTDSGNFVMADPAHDGIAHNEQGYTKDQVGKNLAHLWGVTK